MDIKYGRKRSGIKKELDKKIGDWIETITDEELRDQATENVIVTGGSICSMLMGDPVNDFDLYFRDIDTTYKIAKYYADVFSKNDPASRGIDVRRETRTNIRGEEEERVINYITSAGIASELVPTDKEYRPVFISKNAITLSNKVQLVTRFYGEPDEIHNNYDFVHATCYWDHENQKLHIPAEAMEAMLSRTLIYRGSLYPIASIFRVKKFLERGWRISAGEQLKIMWQISELDLNVFEIMEEQLTVFNIHFILQF